MNYSDLYNNKEKTTTHYIQLWILGIVILSILIILLQIVYNYDINGPRSQILKDSVDFQYMTLLTPKYPPPLLGKYFE